MDLSKLEGLDFDMIVEADKIKAKNNDKKKSADNVSAYKTL